MNDVDGGRLEETRGTKHPSTPEAFDFEGDNETPRKVAKSDDDASEPAGGDKKRRKCNPPPLFGEIRLEALRGVLGKPSKTGSISVSLFNGDTQQPFMATFAMPGVHEEGCDVPFGLEVTHPLREPPSFLGGPAGREVEGLDMLFSLCPAHVRFMEDVEARVKQMALQHSKEWFGKVLREQDIDRLFSSSIKRPAADKSYAPNLRASMVLSAPKDRERILTSIITVKPSAGTVEEGRGWAWVQPRLTEARKWARSKLWPVVEFRTVWITKQGFGLRASFREVIVREQEQQQFHSTAYSDEACRELLGLGERRAA